MSVHEQSINDKPFPYPDCKMLEDPLSDIEEKKQAYESDKQSDKQSEKYVTSPSAASVSSKLIPQTSSRHL
jgi:hypothetical protein